MSFASLRRTAAGTVLLLSLGMSTGLHAADIKGRIRGTVTDPQGAVIPGADVIATNQATGVKFQTKAQSDGAYLFPQLPVGTYTVSVTVPGFQSFRATGILITIDKEYVEQVHLGMGEATQTVEIAADAVQVNTSDMQLNNIVDAAQMRELPLLGRSFTGLETILPGVQPADTRFAGVYSVSGSQAQQSSYMVNGADTNDIALNTIALTPNLDAIDQFNLITGPLNAEYDRNSGGIVSATIIQGTNHFHGDVFEFYRDTFLNTNNFFQKTYSPTTGALTSKVSPYHQNIFGGTIGGPIWKNKLFFFAAYQGTRQRIPQATYQNVVYTAANLTGDFSSDIPSGTFSTNPIPSSINIPGCAAGQTWASCLNPKNGVLPASTFNTITSALAKTYVPAANSGSTGYTFNSTTTSTQDQYIGRVDFSPDSKNQITALGIYQKGVTSNGAPFSGATVPGFGDGSISHIQQWTFDYVRQLSSTTVNDLAAHYTRFNFNSGAPQKVVQPSTAGFAITPQDTASATIPSLAVSNFFTLGGTTNGPQPRVDQVIQLDDNLTKTVGHHNLKFGYDGRRFNVSNLFDSSNSGSYSFASSGTFSTGDPSLDFLLGVPASYSQGTGNVIQADAFLNYIYAQDTWKVSNTITLSYGLGYSIDTPLRNHQYGGLAVSCFGVGQQSTVFPGAPKNLLYPGDPGCTNSAQAYTRHNELGPRFGFAWAPDLGFISGQPGKFSIRGGFGIYYNRTEEESALQTLGTPPFGFSTAGAGDFGGTPTVADPYADINNGAKAGGGALSTRAEGNRFPYVAPTAGQAVDFSGLTPIYFISSFDKSFRAPYAENFQVSLEREFPSRTVARLSYVGSLGRRNQVTYEGNYTTQAGHDACLADADCVSDRTYQALDYASHTIGNNPDFVSIGEVGSYASSNYHSMQASITKATTHGLQFQLSYTYGHALDDASSFENSGFGSSGQRGWNQYQKNLNYGDSTYDVRHNFVFSPVYQVPFFKGSSSHSPLNLALAGWQVSGIVQLSTGQPFDISYGGAASNSLWCSQNVNYYACPDVPLQTAQLVYANPRVRLSNGRTQLFQKTSFAQEPIGRFGNIHRDPYHGPGRNGTNLILAKNFVLRSDGVMSLQLRMESDNVFNHTQFNNPNSAFALNTLTSATSTFGQISSAQSARQTQLGAKFYF